MRAVVHRLVLLLIIGLLSPALQAADYWNANYDSLQRALHRPQPDTARHRLLVHLLDITELTDAKRRQEALPLLDQLLALPKPAGFDARPYQHLLLGTQLWVANQNLRQALRHMQQAVELFDEQQRPIPRLLANLPPLFNQLNLQEERLAYYRRKLAYYRANGAYQNQAACHLAIGGSYRQRGNYNQAISHYLRAADLFRSFDREYYITELLTCGVAYLDWGNLPRAWAYLVQGMTMAERYHIWGIRRFNLLQALAQLELQEQRYATALVYARQAMQVAQRDSVHRLEATAHAELFMGAALLPLHPAKALPHLQRAQHLSDSLDLRISGRVGYFPLDATWAKYHEQRSEYALAESRWLMAYQKATTARLDLYRHKLLKQLIRFYDARRQPILAHRYTTKFLALSDSMDAAHARFNVAYYETERQEKAQNARITALRQTQALQSLRLRQRNVMLGSALAVAAILAGLGTVLYRQLRLNKRTLSKLRQTQRELVAAEKWAFVGEVSADIAHELQNPLTFMKRFAETSSRMLDDMQPSSPKGQNGRQLEHEMVAGLKQNLQEISQHGLRASSIIKGMLEHARTGASQPVATDLNALIATQAHLAQEAFGLQAPTSKAVVSLDLESQLPTLNLVAQDMERVLLNLLTNAFYAVHQREQAGEPDYAPAVEVSTRRVPQKIEVRVRDNGTGIAPEIRERIFNPFFTTKPVGEGTGLGLSMSSEIITKGHGGTLQVQSEVGQFTEFIITLPT